MNPVRGLQITILSLLILTMFSFGLLINQVGLDSTAYMNYAKAEGGNVTEVNITLAKYWKGIYGNVTRTEGGFGTETNIRVISGSPDVFAKNLTMPRCYFTELYATLFPVSPEPTISFINSLEAGNPALVTSFLKISLANPQSGQNVFNITDTFEVGNVSGTANKTINATKLMSASGNYTMGLLKYPATGDLVYVVKLNDSRRGFNNETLDFQIMLPILHNQISDYYFFMDPTDNCDYVGPEPPPSEDGGESIGGGGGTIGTEEEYVVICHKPDSNNPLTLKIAKGLVPGHLNHGDHLGPCVQPLPEEAAAQEDTVIAEELQSPAPVISGPILEFPIERVHQIIPQPVICVSSVLGILALFGLWSYLGYAHQYFGTKLYGTMIALIGAGLVGGLWGAQYCGDTNNIIVTAASLIGVGVLLTQRPLIKKIIKKVA